MFLGAYLIIWVMLVYYFTDAVLSICICTPREKIWNPLMEGHCLDQNTAWKFHAVFNVVSDFLILLLPLPSVWKLQLPCKKKILITSIFATGIL